MDFVNSQGVVAKIIKQRVLIPIVTGVRADVRVLERTISGNVVRSVAAGVRSGSLKETNGEPVV